MNKAFRLEEIFTAAAIRWGEALEGEDANELAVMHEVGETLRAHAAELYNTIVAHNRVVGRLGGSKKLTQLEVSIAILKEFISLNATMTTLTDSIRAGVGYPSLLLRLMCA